MKISKDSHWITRHHFYDLSLRSWSMIIRNYKLFIYVVSSISIVLLSFALIVIQGFALIHIHSFGEHRYFRTTEVGLIQLTDPSFCISNKVKHFVKRTYRSRFLSFTLSQRLIFLRPPVSWSHIFLTEHPFLEQSFHHDSSFHRAAHLPQSIALLFVYHKTSFSNNHDSSFHWAAHLLQSIALIFVNHDTSSSNNLSITTLPFTD